MKKNRSFGGALGPMTRNERRLGRYIRDGEGHPQGGGNQGGGDDTGGGQPQNNGGGNSGDSSGSGGTQNNNGQSFSADAFWNDPAEEGTTNPNQNGQQSQPDNSGQQTGQQIVEAINNYRVDPLFTSDIAAQIAEGNFDAVNEALQTSMQNVMRTTLAHAARIMQDFEGSLEQRMQGMIQSNQTRQTDEQLLTENFATYKTPAMQPVIRGVFNQALKHSGNDRRKALDLTRNMLKEMGQLGQNDFGIRQAPSGPDDFQSEGPSSLVRDLLEMK